MKRRIFFLLFMIPWALSAQNPKTLLNNAFKKFAKVQNYIADVHMDFDLPSVSMDAVTGQVFYKSPNKFRIKSKGIAFVPKQNPYFSLNELRDTNSYVAVLQGAEKIRNINCRIINVIPSNPTDMILGKFWIDAANNVILKSQITTASNGTIQLDNYFGTQKNFALPDKMVITVEMTKFKMPKALSAELNSKSSKTSSKKEKGTGKISMDFTNYKINTRLNEDVFK